jgi:hypothetical protein
MKLGGHSRTLAQISDVTLAWLAAPATLRNEVALSLRL